jgi:hypothetical protein
MSPLGLVAVPVPVLAVVVLVLLVGAAKFLSNISRFRSR